MTPARWKREDDGQRYICATCGEAFEALRIAKEGMGLFDAHEASCSGLGFNELASRQPWVDGSFSFHRKSQYGIEAKALAFAEVFNSLPGRIVHEALFDAVCMTQMASERDLGKHDLWLYICETIAVGEAIQARRGDHGRAAAELS